MLDDLRSDLTAADEAKRQEWDRSLPAGEHLSDRWDRARRLGFGVGSSIYDSAIVMGQVRVGDNVWIGPATLLDGTGGGLVIGDWCNISAGTHIYTHDTVLSVLSGGEVERRTGPVTIGDRTYIGPQCIIAAGVTIGRMAVVGAGSFVNADVGDRTVVAGSPARVVGRIDGDGADVRVARLGYPHDLTNTA